MANADFNPKQTGTPGGFAAGSYREKASQEQAEQQQAIRFAFAGMHVFYKIYKYCEQHSGKDKQSCRKRFDIIGGSGDEQQRACGKIQYGDAAEVCVEPMMLSVLYVVRVKKDRRRDELNHHEAQCA